MPEPDPAIVGALRRLQLVGEDETPATRALPGGVSSDIWRVDLPDGPVCVKRALARLKVDALWEVPVERSRYEWAWMQEAARVDPAWVPPLVAQDPRSSCLVMGFLDPTDHPLWKAQLRRGHAHEPTAREVGARLAAIHRATAGRGDLRDRFDTTGIFHAIRLEPYLLATAERHPDLRPRLAGLAAATAETRLALVHGDVSPKNILVGPRGPVFLDAECAWYGDPAFDVAFCLNHLLLKCLWTPAATPGFLSCFDGLAGTYLDGADWEPRERLEARAAGLLPGLLLARVDGKSPVEYLTTEEARNHVRGAARRLLREPVATLAAVREAWAASLHGEPSPRDGGSRP